MSTRTTTARPSTRTESKQKQRETLQEPSAPDSSPAEDRCSLATCGKLLGIIKAECPHCRKLYCMEHRHPETHAPQVCGLKARSLAREGFQRDSGHILGVEARNPGVTHRQPGWNINASRAELQQKFNQRVQDLKESSGRSTAAGSSSSSSSSTSPSPRSVSQSTRSMFTPSPSPNMATLGSLSSSSNTAPSSEGPKKNQKKSGGSKKKAQPMKIWGAGGARLGGPPAPGVPGAEP